MTVLENSQNENDRQDGTWWDLSESRVFIEEACRGFSGALSTGYHATLHSCGDAAGKGLPNLMGDSGRVRSCTRVVGVGVDVSRQNLRWERKGQKSRARAEAGRKRRKPTYVKSAVCFSLRRAVLRTCESAERRNVPRCEADWEDGCGKRQINSRCSMLTVMISSEYDREAGQGKKREDRVLCTPSRRRDPGVPRVRKPCKL